MRGMVTEFCAPAQNWQVNGDGGEPVEAARSTPGGFGMFNSMERGVSGSGTFRRFGRP